MGSPDGSNLRGICDSSPARIRCQSPSNSERVHCDWPLFHHTRQGCSPLKDCRNQRPEMKQLELIRGTALQCASTCTTRSLITAQQFGFLLQSYLSAARPCAPQKPLPLGALTPPHGARLRWHEKHCTRWDCDVHSLKCDEL